MNRHSDRHRLRDLRDDRRGYAPPAKPKKGHVGKVFAILAAVVVVGVVTSRMGCHADEAKTLPPKKQLASLKPKELQQQTAEYGIEGGALAGKKIVAADAPIDTTGEAVDPEVRPTNTGFVVLKVRSTRPHVLPADRDQAVREAEAEARRVLAEQGKVPPGEWKVTFDPNKVHDIPPSKSVREEWEAKGLGTDRGWVEIEEVTLAYDTLRAERAKDRTTRAAFWFGTAFLALLAAYGFLRLDMWTKGYLTVVLGVVVGVAVVAAVVVLGLLVF